MVTRSAGCFFANAANKKDHGLNFQAGETVTIDQSTLGGKWGQWSSTAGGLEKKPASLQKRRVLYSPRVVLRWQLAVYGCTTALSLEYLGYDGDFDLHPAAVVDVTSSVSSGVSTNLYYT